MTGNTNALAASSGNRIIFSTDAIYRSFPAEFTEYEIGTLTIDDTDNNTSVSYVITVSVNQDGISLTNAVGEFPDYDTYYTRILKFTYNMYDNWLGAINVTIGFKVSGTNDTLSEVISSGSTTQFSHAVYKSDNQDASEAEISNIFIIK